MQNDRFYACFIKKSEAVYLIVVSFRAFRTKKDASLFNKFQIAALQNSV